MSSYFEQLCASMEKLAEIPETVFIGQAVAYPGTAMYRTLEKVPAERRLELPVAEDMQMGMAIGMALRGLLPICIYPRWNFLLLATSQLVLHLDKLQNYSRGQFKPKVIIRTAIATSQPMDPGPQHLGDFTEAYRTMLVNTYVHRLENAYDVRERYAQAIERYVSTILVEDASKY